MKTAEQIFEQVCTKNDINGYWTLDEYKRVALPMFENIVEAMEEFAKQSTRKDVTEGEAEQDFKDWLGWNDQPPPKDDDPDYYTYSWGMNVWINCMKTYKLLKKWTTEQVK